MKQNLKQKLKSNTKVLGTWCMTSSVTAAEILASSGLDFVIIDMEHSSVSFETVENMVRACSLRGCSSIIRLYNSDEQVILRALETGCDGIMVPHITTSEEAKAVVDSCLYSPRGKRGLSPYTRNHDFSHVELVDSLARNNENMFIGVLVEGKKGIDNLPSIVKVEGLDLIYTGVYDISSSIGFPGDLMHPEVLKIQKDCVELITENKKISGTFASDEEYLKVIDNLGYRFLAFSSDGFMLKNSYTQLRDRFNG